MSLIDDLRKLGAAFPPSHAPAPGELPGVVGALVSLIEQGPDLLKHVESDYETVAKFVSGIADEIVPDAPAATSAPADSPASAPAATTAPAPSAEEFAAMQEQVKQLLAQNQSLQEAVTAQAAASRTVADVPTDTQSAA